MKHGTRVVCLSRKPWGFLFKKQEMIERFSTTARKMKHGGGGGGGRRQSQVRTSASPCLKNGEGKPNRFVQRAKARSAGGLTIVALWDAEIRKVLMTADYGHAEYDPPSFFRGLQHRWYFILLG